MAFKFNEKIEFPGCLRYTNNGKNSNESIKKFKKYRKECREAMEYQRELMAYAYPNSKGPNNKK